MTPKLRCGVIGTGAFAQACHIPGLQSHPEATVVAVCGSDERRTREVADRFGIPTACTDVTQLCAREDIDAVTIATVNARHAAEATAAIAAGKHVLCEKPLATTVGEAERMTRAADEHGIVHMVAFTFRYGYAVRELRRRLRAGELGDPYYVRIQYDNWAGLRSDWRVNRKESMRVSGGGMLFELGSHLFDIVQFACGPIHAVSGWCVNVPRLRAHEDTGLPTPVDTDDLAAAWFRIGTGSLRGHWFASRATPPQVPNGFLEVVGPKCALKAALSRGGVDTLLRSIPDGSGWEPQPLPEQAADLTPHNLTLMMHSFVAACLRGRSDAELDASFHDGLRAQRAMAALQQASRDLGGVSSAASHVAHG